MLLLESTYGDRLHEPDDGGARLAAIINETVQRGGRVIIPSFAVGRVEELLYWLRLLERSQADSDAARVRRQPDGGRRAAVLHAALQRAGSRACGPASATSCVFGTERMTIVASAQESMELVSSSTPAIVIAASGMATGGRVLHHLAAGLPNPNNTVLFVGYQSAGTRGRQLLRRRQEGEDSGSGGAGGRAHRTHRLDVGARGCRRDHALAVRVLPSAVDDLSRPRRACRARGARLADSDASSAGRFTSRSISRRSNCLSRSLDRTSRRSGASRLSFNVNHRGHRENPRRSARRVTRPRCGKTAAFATRVIQQYSAEHACSESCVLQRMLPSCPGADRAGRRLLRRGVSIHASSPRARRSRPTPGRSSMAGRSLARTSTGRTGERETRRRRCRTRKP